MLFRPDLGLFLPDHWVPLRVILFLLLPTPLFDVLFLPALLLLFAILCLLPGALLLRFMLFFWTLCFFSALMLSFLALWRLEARRDDRLDARLDALLEALLPLACDALPVPGFWTFTQATWNENLELGLCWVWTPTTSSLPTKTSCTSPAGEACFQTNEAFEALKTQ